MWFKEEPSQFSMGQTAQRLTCSIMEKPHTGLEECLRILLSCFRARNSGRQLLPREVEQKTETAIIIIIIIAIAIAAAVIADGRLRVDSGMKSSG